MSKSLTDCLVKIMSDGRPWTFWELQEEIKKRYDVFYGEPTISAGIRELRRHRSRKKYDLPITGEIITKEKIKTWLYEQAVLSKGYKYRLITNNEETL